MKKILFIVPTTLALFFSQGKLASATSVTILVQVSNGKALSNIPITCTANRPRTPGAIPPPPIFGNLTTNSSGVAVWNAETGEGYTQSCHVAYAMTPDSCYAFPSGTGNFTLINGENKSLTISAKYLNESCGTRIPQTEAEALGQAKDTVKPTLTPLPSPSLLLSPTPTPTIPPRGELLFEPPKQVSGVKLFFTNFSASISHWWRSLFSKR